MNTYKCNVCSERQQSISPMQGCRKCYQDVCQKCYRAAPVGNNDLSSLNQSEQKESFLTDRDTETKQPKKKSDSSSLVSEPKKLDFANIDTDEKEQFSEQATTEHNDSVGNYDCKKKSEGALAREQCARLGITKPEGDKRINETWIKALQNHYDLIDSEEKQDDDENIVVYIDDELDQSGQNDNSCFQNNLKRKRYDNEIFPLCIKRASEQQRSCIKGYFSRWKKSTLVPANKLSSDANHMQKKDQQSQTTNHGINEDEQIQNVQNLFVNNGTWFHTVEDKDDGDRVNIKLFLQKQQNTYQPNKSTIYPYGSDADIVQTWNALKNTELTSKLQQLITSGKIKLVLTTIFTTKYGLMPFSSRDTLGKPIMFSNWLDHEKARSLLNVGYSFDGVYFESIEQLAAFSQIEELKKSYELKDENKWSNQLKNIEYQSPQLYKFIMKNQEVFKEYSKGDNNTLSSLLKVDTKFPIVLQNLQSDILLKQTISNAQVNFTELNAITHSNFSDPEITNNIWILVIAGQIKLVNPVLKTQLSYI